MTIVLYACIWLAMACYWSAAFLTWRYAFRGEAVRLNRAINLSTLGGVIFLVVFFLRWAQWQLVPMTTLPDSLLLLVMMCTFVMLWLTRGRKIQALLCFYLPPLAAMTLLAPFVAYHNYDLAPRELSSVPLMLHVGLAFLAYALFLLAAMTSIAYLYQARRLKRHNTTGLFHRLPSLEQLDDTLIHLIKLGYPLFLVTLVLGGIWSFVARDLLGPNWWLSPKVLLSLFMAVLYMVTFHLRRAGKLHGERLAWVMAVSFLSLLAIYILLAMLELREINFWVDSV